MKFIKNKYKDYILSCTLYLKEEYENPSISFEIYKSKSFLSAFELIVGGENSDFRIWSALFGNCINLYMSFLSVDFKRKYIEKARIKVERLNKNRKRMLNHFDFDPWYSSPRTTGFYLSNEMLFLSLWSCVSSSYNDKFKNLPWNNEGWEYSVLWRDKLFGIMEVEDGSAELDEDMFFMPEGMYLVNVEKRQRKWHRNRWPFSLFNDGWVWQATIRIENGIPTPRKHTVINSISLPVTKEYPTNKELFAKLRDDLLSERISYEGEDWEPKDGWPAHCIMATE